MNFWNKIYKFVDISLCKETQKITNLFGFICHRNDKEIQRKFIAFPPLNHKQFKLFRDFKEPESASKYPVVFLCLGRVYLGKTQKFSNPFWLRICQESPLIFTI
jgi:hypothetical protein